MSDPSYRSALRIALGYALFAGLWIIFSDQAIAVLTSDPQMLTILATAKGWFFVIVTTVLLYLFLKREVEHILAVHDRARCSDTARASSEARLWGIIRNSPIGVAIGRDMRFQFTNPAFQSMTGYTGEELAELNVLDLFAPHVREGLRQGIAGRYAGDTVPVSYYSYGLKKDGTVFPVHISSAAIVTATGPEVAAFITDVSALRRTEEELQIYNEWLRALFEASPLAIVILDAEGRMVMANPAFERVFGYPWEELAGEVPPIIPPEHKEAFDNRMTEVLAGRTLNGAETYSQCKDGRILNVSLSAAPLRTGDGRVTGVMGILADITESKLAEAELLRAKTAAEEANQAKTLFLRNMSHELRTPLNGIMGMISIVRETVGESESEMLDMAQSSAGDLLQILNDLIALSGLESGRLALRQERFGLRIVLVPLFASMRVRSDLKGLDFHAAIAEDVPDEAIGDPGRFVQILFNLIANAIRFTERGRVEVGISLDQDLQAPDNGFCLACTVRDTGIGIAPEKLKDIFESFTLGEDYLTKRYGGAGLGLSICRQLTAKMGGRIEVQSVLGLGSEFVLRLPLMHPENGRKPGETASDRTSVLTAGPQDILFVEDDPINRLFAGAALRDAGHRVVFAENGQMAMHMLTSQPFDLVMMDLQMPVLNGLDAARFIRSGQAGQEQAIRNIPIVAVTAYPQDVTSERERLFNGFVAKPYEAEDLVRAISLLFAKS